MKINRIIILLIILLCINGCTNNDDNESGIKTLEKAPDSLAGVYDQVNSILENVGKIERIALNINFDDEEEIGLEQEGITEDQEGENPQTSAEDTASNEEEGGQEQESNQEGSNQESSEGFDESSNDDKINEIWLAIDKSLEDIYLEWSNYANEATKKGITQDRITDFKNSTNKLTKAVEEKNIIDSYDFASQTLANLRPFFDLYKDEYRGEIAEIRYFVYRYYINAINNNDEAAMDAVNSHEETINRIRMAIDDDEEMINSLEKVVTSLNSLGISLEEDSKRVYMLEKDTLIKNLESLE